MKKVDINGRTFELAKDTRNFYEVINNFRYDGRTIYDCYKKCSHIKELIYALWKNWINDTCMKCEIEDWEYHFKMGVQSYNYNMFTLAMIVNWKDEWYYLYITPSHNRAWRLTFN